MSPPAPASDAGVLREVGGGYSRSARTAEATSDLTDRQLIRTSPLTVRVDDEEDVAPTLDAARALAEAMNGSLTPEGPGWLLPRIPDADLDQLSALGDADDRHVYTRDVTAECDDLEIRPTNAHALQTRLRTLLEQAEGVPDVLAVERELARVTPEVETLEGQLRLLQNQVAFSTVRLTVRDAVRPGPLGWVVGGAYEVVTWLFVWD